MKAFTTLGDGIAALNLDEAEVALARGRMDGSRVSRPCAITETAINIEACPSRARNCDWRFGRDIGGVDRCAQDSSSCKN